MPRSGYTNSVDSDSTAVTTIAKKGGYLNVFEGTHPVGSYSTLSAAWTKAITYLGGSRSWQDDIRLRGDITINSQITVPEYTMVRGPAMLRQGFNGTLFTDEKIGDSLNADEITMRDLNFAMDATTYNTAGTVIHMCVRDSTFENLKMWGALNEAVIFESKGGGLSERILANTLNNIWIGRHGTLGSYAGGLYFKEDGSGNGVADMHCHNIYIINCYNYQLRIEYGANNFFDQMHLTGYGTGYTNATQFDGTYQLFWTSGTVESCRGNGVYIDGGSNHIYMSNILFTGNGNYTDNTYCDVLVDSTSSTNRDVNLNRCQFRWPTGGSANLPLYNIYFKGANSDYCTARENHFDPDYYSTDSTEDESGTGTIENNNNFAS